MSNPKDCHRFEECSAPLCPMDEEYLGDSVWYPDEEICSNQSYSRVPFIRRQRKAVKVRNKEYYFSRPMLEHPCVIGRAFEGADPDSPNEKKWFKDHPALKEKTEEQKQVFRERILKVNETAKQQKNESSSRGFDT